MLSNYRMLTQQLDQLRGSRSENVFQLSYPDTAVGEISGEQITDQLTYLSKFWVHFILLTTLLQKVSYTIETNVIGRQVLLYPSKPHLFFVLHNIILE